ncbi:hypothetical protein ACX0HA_03840 [Flavobacterium hauense]
MKKTLLFLAVLFSGFAFAQSVNDYKYVVVPERFTWLKEANEYNLNVLTKTIFEKQGWQVFYPTQKMPDELALDRCKALYANVDEKGGLLSTALTITLKDCSGKTVFTSIEGKSKQKSYQKAYYEALREASQSIGQLNYKYAGKDTPVKAAVIIPSTQQAVAPTIVNNENQLFAQPIANGYQLVDNTPKVILKIYKTSQQDSFTAVSDTKNGVVFKKGNDWVFEYYLNDKLISEKLNIKF